MASQLSWHYEGRILYLSVSGKLSGAVLLKSAQQAAEMIEAASERVHLVINAQRLAGLEKNTSALRNVLAPLLTHERMGWGVVITSNFVLQAQLNRIVNRMTSNWGYVKTFTDAIRLLRQVDAGLPIVSVSPGGGSSSVTIRQDA